MKAPEPGLITKAKVSRVIDGDTIEVEIVRRFNVRVRDLMVAENNTELGKSATSFLTAAINHSEVTVFIPSNDAQKLMDINSFNRLVGDVWLVDGSNLVDVMEFHNLGRRIRKGEKPHQGE